MQKGDNHEVPMQQYELPEAFESASPWADLPARHEALGRALVAATEVGPKPYHTSGRDPAIDRAMQVRI